MVGFFLVAIHGRWCGPNWTDGRNISARDYLLAGGDFKSPCVDSLDCACREHDRACAGPNGCTAKADRILAAKAQWIAITNSKLRPVAQAVASAIALASLTRRR
jgi:hypothetical protein